MFNKKTNYQLISSRDQLNKSPSKVGQAVYDILCKPQEMQEVGETLEAMTPRYYEELLSTVDNNKDKYDPPFYILVLRKKEGWAVNVLRQWFIARQTKPSPWLIREDYPNYDQDVWLVNTKDEEVRLLWTLPTHQDALTILKNKHLYHSDIVKWIQDYYAGVLA